MSVGGSQHTVKGDRKDLEICWTHTPQVSSDAIDMATLAILFDENADVDTELQEASYAFLDWLVADISTPEAPAEEPAAEAPAEEAPPAEGARLLLAQETDAMAALFEAVCWNARYTYAGSSMQPNCYTKVQHGVLKAVLPIKAEHIAAIKDFVGADFFENS